MSTPILKLFTVQLHRRGGKTKGRIEVAATCDKHAGRVAVAQTIEVSFPKSKPGDWVVTNVEAKGFSMEQPKNNPLVDVAVWNNAVQVGQEVDYRSDPDAAPQRFKTRTPAELASAGYAVVWLEGKSGYVTCESLIPVQGKSMGPRCSVRGMLPGGACGAVMVGGRECTSTGYCEYQVKDGAA